MRLAAAVAVLLVAACGKVFSSAPASGGGIGGSGDTGGTGGATSTSSSATPTTSTNSAGGSGGEGGHGGAPASEVPAACALWCDSYEASDCTVPGSGDCATECLARFSLTSQCDAEAAALLQCYASQWTIACTVPDLCEDYLLAWASCLTSCATASCTSDSDGDGCGCTASCGAFSAVAECSRFNLYCYCRFSGPLDLNPDDQTLQTTCWPSQEPTCQPAVPGCCGAIFF